MIDVNRMAQLDYDCGYGQALSPLAENLL